ncbi:oxidoreductase [Mycolicibacterium agri]|uniref:Oxidoreductase n=1 Tax=Mycolicibacterium agri TaxID=36811 RepID=A0A2A7N1M7_MYCAG|nr:ferredoxin reductase [Mycolicibacterium agri]PEG37796.1 oxidoreductase [Mycolicibacterium agri]GFG54878.1 oxidoreductase [Mycolicibacterium agri]
MDAALTPGLPWRVARVVDSTPETATARSIHLAVPGWRGHLAGQHIDLKLTAEDGYTAQRSYSLSRPADGEHIELTVQRIDDGEVSPYLTEMEPGEQIELRGPIGGWFVWRPAEEARVMLVAGGSGIVPLMAMLRQRLLRGSSQFRLVYSVRTPADVYYAHELSRLERDCDWLRIDLVYTRAAPPQTPRITGRIRLDDLEVADWTPGRDLRVYICGPTGFVESVAAKLIEYGHSPSAIRTERFGPSG